MAKFGPRPRPTADRFWPKVEKSSGCWRWLGAVNRAGYGVTWDGQKTQLAHRTAWVLLRGEITGGLHVLHRCDNPPCVNPSHLFLGDDLANILDSIAKDRWWKTRSPEKMLQARWA